MMTRSAVQATVSETVAAQAKAELKKTAQVSWEEFKKKYLTREDSFKYEWVNGKVEKTKRTMDKSQLFIQLNLQAIFRDLLSKGMVHGDLFAEGDLFFLENHRRPDIAWLTIEQVYHLADEQAYEVPAFVIEIVSNNDAMVKMEKKMDDYRAAGVQVVWHVFPKMEKVHVYNGDRLRHATICEADDICSAAPVLPAFAFPASEIFRKTMPAVAGKDA